MRIPTMTISTQNARLEMKNIFPKQVLEITQKQPQIQIEIEPGFLEIDSTESRAALGQFTTPRGIQEAAKRGRDAVLQFIEAQAQEGKRLAAIENKNNAFAELALQKTAPPSIQLQIVSIPKPEFQYHPSKVTISNKTSPEEAVQIQYRPNPYEAQYFPGKVTIDVQL